MSDSEGRAMEAPEHSLSWKHVGKPRHGHASHRKPNDRKLSEQTGDLTYDIFKKKHSAPATGLPALADSPTAENSARMFASEAAMFASISSKLDQLRFPEKRGRSHDLFNNTFSKFGGNQAFGTAKGRSTQNSFFATGYQTARHIEPDSAVRSGAQGRKLDKLFPGVVSHSREQSSSSYKLDHEPSEGIRDNRGNVPLSKEAIMYDGSTADAAPQVKIWGAVTARVRHETKQSGSFDLLMREHLANSLLKSKPLDQPRHEADRGVKGSFFCNRMGQGVNSLRVMAASPAGSLGNMNILQSPKSNAESRSYALVPSIEHSYRHLAPPNELGPEGQGAFRPNTNQTEVATEMKMVGSRDEFGALAHKQLPSNIDEVRMILSESNFAKLDLQIVHQLHECWLSYHGRVTINRGAKVAQNERLLTILPPKAAPKQTSINKDNCNLDTIFKGRLAKSRIDVALINDWTQNWLSKIDKTGKSLENLSEMRDILAFGSERLHNSLSGSFKTQAELFRTIHSGWMEFFELILGEMNSYLKTEEDRRAKEIESLHELETELRRAYVGKLDMVSRELEKKKKNVDELAQVIRQLNVRIGTNLYAQKYYKSEIRDLEAQRQILNKENVTLNDVISNIKKELQGMRTAKLRQLTQCR